MQKIIMARTLALSLAAGILFTACSDNNAQKAEGDQATEVAKVDGSTTDVTAGLGGDKPLDRLKQAPKELGKSLGRVMDTITQPIERAFAPRVESKEMEKNSKYFFERLLKDRIFMEENEQALGEVDFEYKIYNVEKDYRGDLHYKVLILGTLTTLKDGEKRDFTQIFAATGKRKQFMDDVGKIAYTKILDVHSFGFISSNPYEISIRMQPYKNLLENGELTNNAYRNILTSLNEKGMLSKKAYKTIIQSFN